MSSDKPGKQQQQQQKMKGSKEESKKDSSGDDDQVTVEIHFDEPDLVYTIRYDGGVPAQAAFDESVEKGISEFLAATGISKEEFLSHPEANLDGKTVAEWAASTNSVPRVSLTTKPKNGLLAKLQCKTKEAEVARLVMDAREHLALREKEERLVRDRTQLEKKTQANEERRLLHEQHMKKRMAADEEEAKKKAAEVKKDEERARLVKQRDEQLLNHNRSLQKQLGETKEELKTIEKLLQEQLDKQMELVEEEVAKQAEVFRMELDNTRAGYEAEKLRLETKLQENLAAYNEERSSRYKDTKAKKLLQKQLKTKEAEKSSDENTITELIAQVESQGKKVVELEEKVVELEEKILELQKNNSELQKNNSELQKNNSELQKKNSELDKKNSELQKKIVMLEKELKSRTGSLEKDIVELKQENLKLKQDINPEFNSEGVKKQQYEKEVAALWSAIAKLQTSAPPA